MSNLKLMLQMVVVAALVHGTAVFAQTTNPEEKAPADTATKPTEPENKAAEPAAATPEPENKAAEPAAATPEPENKAAEPAAAMPEPENEAAEPASTAVSASALAAAEAELTRVQATKTRKDKWDKCEETSHWVPSSGPNDAYKVQMDCMGQSASSK